MDFMEAIITRTSVRQYTGEKITPDQFNQILKAGFSAPSAHNLQPWHFIWIDDDVTLAAVAQMHPYAKMMPKAGGGILVCGDQTIQKVEGFIVEDCSAAIENMLIAINGMGLGGVWIGVHPVETLIEKVKALFQLPDAIMPIGFIAVGHSDSDRGPIDKYKADRIHHNAW